PPAAGTLIRKLLHLGQSIASHALSFFHLSSPDFLLGWDSDPAKRNILGVAEKFPDIARRGVRLRKFGHEISERITGKKVHLIGIVAGGMLTGLEDVHRKALLEWIPEVLETTKIGISIFKDYRDKNKKEVENFASFETLYLGTVTSDGAHELYDGKLRFVDADGKIIGDQLDPKNYLDYISEKPVEWSWLKYPFYKPYGQPKGFYRVGPLARLNVASKMQTPLADRELKEFKAIGNTRPVQGSFYYHYARLIETLTAIEQIQEILNDSRVTSKEIFAKASRNQAEGVGCSEAPRGTLFHHYITDENGILQKVNLLIATGQNNPAMNRGVLEVAKQYVDGHNLKEGMLNRVEATIRCYDPCLSCSTHAIGAMPLVIELRDHAGEIVNVIRKGG
ncbi:MAG: Ni/Fe hydrogenase subunit alpha, partial [Candidatus Omnitrophica bacterium]|nr:Ni/Fe hydrogenase subunit alpha [Candidatus Omnitrophota bacterium]